MRGGDFDRVDLTVRGALASTGLRMAIEEHGAGRQLVRVRVLPRPSPAAVVATLIAATLAAFAAFDGAPVAAVALGGTALLVVAAGLAEAAAATGHVQSAIEMHAAGARPAVESGARSATAEEALAG